MPSFKWQNLWHKSKDNNDDDDTLPVRRDNNYQEINRKASFKSFDTHVQRPSAHRTETNVKLRRIGPGSRRVFVNLPLPDYELDNKGRPLQKYASNRIRTSKYTILTFVPKNLFEQFRRPANLYFLGMAVLQLLPLFGIKSPALTLLPICTVVFVTAAKDAFEDFERHKVDEQYNQNVTHTLHGYRNPNYLDETLQDNKFLSWFSSNQRNPNKETTADDAMEQNDHFKKSLSKDVRVGDFILLRNGDSLPADAVLLSTSDKEGLCYVETKDLDGETNLKPRKSIQELKHIQSGSDCLDDCHFYIETGTPTPDLYSFEGTLVTLEKSPTSDKWVKKNKTPVEINNMLLRGHVLRNTKWAIAVVVFTGTETKIMLNSGKTPSKRSQIDKEMNKEVYVAFIVLFVLCLLCAIMSGVMRARQMSSPAASLYTADKDSPGYAGFLNFWSSLIIFQNIIPISLYVAIEFVKTFQAYLIYQDLDMWDEQSQKTCVPKTWTLSDDLGQVEYIFSDKTGTLTRNIMEFRECTIDGVRYGDNGFSPESEGARGARLRKEKAEMQAQDQSTNTSELAPSDQQPSSFSLIDGDEDELELEEEIKAEEKLSEQKQHIIQEYEAALKNVFDPTYSSLNINKLSFADPQIFKDIQNADMNTSSSNQKSATIKEFFMALALCHTVMVEKIGKDGKPIEEENDEENDEERTQPKIGDDKDSPNNGSRSTLADNTGKKSITSKVIKGSAKLLKAPNRIKKSDKKDRELQRTRSRGEEFDVITNEKDTLDRVDPTVKTQIEYKAESPDEAALVNAAKNVGFAFIGRKEATLTLDILGNEYDFELLNVLEFNSDRKRMSVIIRRPEPWNDIILYCKGADSIISGLLDKTGQDEQTMHKTFNDVDKFSENGLRTLLLAYRSIEEDEYQKWKVKMDEASTAVEERAEKIEKVQAAIEVNLKLLGATGIEDKLQEGVPKCIEDLRHAGIKVWVLTGDKLETAINIGYASNLLDADMKLWTVRGAESAEKVSHHLRDTLENLEKLEGNQQEHALVIEGSALLHIFESDDLKELFLQIAIRCKSVICCRVSPLQKALVVKLVRKYHNVVALAIGDGANDVSMIQVANVGVGIAGQEGVQAAMAADYAISQFRFLDKLVLVQGHWSYARISEMILNFFFKNVLWVFPSLWYQIYSGWSGNIFYDYSFLQLYNLIFTIAPVCAIGATDQDLTAPYLKRFPQVYEVGIERKLYTRFRFWLYFLDAIWQSVVSFFAFYLLYIGGNPNSNGLSESMLQLSTSVAITAIVLANLMPGFNTYYWTYWQFLFTGIELIIAFLWIVVYGAFSSNSLYGMASMVFGSGTFWMTFLLAVIIAFLPRYVITFVYQWWFPNAVAKGRQFECHDKRMKRKKRKESTTDSKREFSDFKHFICYPFNGKKR
ncbi:hypothetical protein EDC96DRAFT_541090 [Choanephora cucurbitarum]|nr:hypothetical protein EDC96DRAFT_541090 [Choanephora cucurbitarum]